MNEPQQDSREQPNVLAYARPDGERRPSTNAGIVSLIGAALGAVGYILVVLDVGPVRAVGAMLVAVGSLVATISGFAGLVSRCPPGRRVIAAIGLLLGLSTLALLVIPSLGAPRERAQRVKCASNLRQIGQGILLYANDHGNKLPATIGQLYADEDLPPDVFICPDSGLDKSPGATTQQVLADLRTSKHCSYTYYGAGLTFPIDPSFILASESLGHHRGDGLKDGINILFGDGHVQWLEKTAAAKVLAELGAGQNPPPSLSPRPATGGVP